MVEFSLVLLFILILGLCFVLMSLFLYLIIKKYLNNQTRQEIAECKEAYRLDMFRYLQTGEQQLLHVKQGEEEFKALVELLSEYSTVLDGANVQERISLFAKQYLTSYIKKELKQRRWSLRMNALYSIDVFYMDHLRETLHDLYKKKKTTIAEKAQILKLFALFNDEQLVYYIKEVNQNISNFSILSILSKIEEEKFDELVAEFASLSARMQYMVIETIEKRQHIKHHPFLQKLMLTEDEELQIRSLKAVANIGVRMDWAPIPRLLDSESWQIRMMATKVVGMQRIEPLKGKLIELLSDREYMVRSEAAKAILRFKDGVSILTSVTKESNDLFAKDMAIEWLERESGGYSY